MASDATGVEWDMIDEKAFQMMEARRSAAAAANLQGMLAGSEAPAAAEVERLRGQLADFAEALTRGNRAVMTIALQRDAAERERDEMREVLRSLEWAGTDDGYEGGNEPCCPSCGWSELGGSHAPACRLVAALADCPTAGRTDGSSTEGGRDHG